MSFEIWVLENPWSSVKNVMTDSGSFGVLPLRFWATDTALSRGRKHDSVRHWTKGERFSGGIVSVWKRNLLVIRERDDELF